MGNKVKKIFKKYNMKKEKKVSLQIIEQQNEKLFDMHVI